MNLKEKIRIMLFHPLKTIDVFGWKWAYYVVNKEINRRSNEFGKNDIDKNHYGWMSFKKGFAYSVFCIQQNNLINFLKKNIPNEVGKIIELGAASDLFLKEVDAKKKIGIDALPVCIEKLKKNGIEGRLAVNGEKIPAENNEANAAICFETLEHVQNPIQFLRELERIIELGGFLLLSIPNVKSTRILSRFHNDSSKGRPEAENHIFEFSQEDFAKIISYTNFKIAKFELLENYKINYNFITNYLIRKHILRGYFSSIQAYVLRKD
jgi:2-polyprenyl-3-methyl-5-hydroxy-6-metoxy-1,4-benzoquinol methylase